MNHQEESREEKILRLMTQISGSRMRVELLQKEYEMRQSRIAALEKEKIIAERKLLKKLEEIKENGGQNICIID